MPCFFNVAFESSNLEYLLTPIVYWLFFCPIKIHLSFLTFATCIFPLIPESVLPSVHHFCLFLSLFFQNPNFGFVEFLYFIFILYVINVLSLLPHTFIFLSIFGFLFYDTDAHFINFHLYFCNICLYIDKLHR